MTRESDNQSQTNDGSKEVEPRRGFMGKVSGVVMTVGLVGGYGSVAAIGARYLYPANGTPKKWFFVAVVEGFKKGDSLRYTAPDGAKVTVTRQGDKDEVASFTALSSICPHLGCQVHWEAAKNRFFCPCHNGAFDPDGVAIAGPPKEAGQTLSRFPLKIENGLLYIQVATESLVAQLEDDAPPGPGHDPCLYRSFPEETA